MVLLLGCAIPNAWVAHSIHLRQLLKYPLLHNYLMFLLVSFLILRYSSSLSSP